MEIILPKQKIKAERSSPKNMIVFSKPKTGKTSLFAELPNGLLIDLEEGSDHVDATKIKANSVEELFAIGKQIIAENRPYQFIALDTLTALEEMCLPYAELIYCRKAVGKNWFKKDAAGKLAPDSGKAQYGNILNLPNGAGYAHHREAVSKVVEYVKTWATYVLFGAHVKDILLEKSGAEFTASDLDLTGKIKRTMCAQSDAIGYLYRKGNENILSFVTKETIICGARPAHLRNAEIVVSEMTDNGLVTHWDRIYID